MPTPATPHDPATTNGTHHDDLPQLLLQICEDFLATTGPATHHEVDALLRARGITGGPGWLIDMLGLTRLRLQNATHGNEQGAQHDA
ncbi:hypothetical protein O7630_33115 [Micromonospora sp. WMMD718]|uniref:hypothetical protein n=1 Tax=Micromonospora sp. WMMD718 TaxID=3016098 RepID=UPI002415E298|nr:hypothetical protein [Micromonospora sp. WMMD718]MDG4750862.1 hypothetical protein [Micromonospora sp. WMMD718]MDG4752684.1 hypothetical protein [Micromonospora sp. WMMD718]MDG4755789.1 hypothetical protein [Micromonospora sp. WMMD718]